MPRAGTIYVLASGRHPGVLKLGRTARTADLRLAELTRTPGYRGFAPWRLVHLQPTADAVLVERWSHRLLRRRVHRLRLRLGCLELYRASEAEVCDVVQQVAAAVEARRIRRQWLTSLADMVRLTLLLMVVLLGVVLWLAR